MYNYTCFEHISGKYDQRLHHHITSHLLILFTLRDLSGAAAIKGSVKHTSVLDGMVPSKKICNGLNACKYDLALYIIILTAITVSSGTPLVILEIFFSSIRLTQYKLEHK